MEVSITENTTHLTIDRGPELIAIELGLAEYQTYLEKEYGERSAVVDSMLETFKATKPYTGGLEYSECSQCTNDTNREGS